MALADKMFSRKTKTCPLRSDCRNDQDKRYFSDLFSADWDVFVIQRNDAKGGFDWFTACCESALRCKPSPT